MPLEIIYNQPHASIAIYIDDSASRVAILHLIQEIKRDIIYRRMTVNAPPGPVPMVRIHAHISSVITKMSSLMEYQGCKTQSDLMLMMRIMTASLQEMID
jgi:hypothetical protein